MNTEEKIIQVPIEDIIPNRFQPRLAFDEEGLKELSESIKQHGIIQPLVLRRLGDKYEIIAGERRYKASIMAGLRTVPAVISNIDDNQSAEIALVENIQRRNLTPIEEAKSYKNLLDRGYMTQEQLAEKMGVSQSSIANKLRLLNLAPEVQDALLQEKISERHARSLLSLPKEEQAEWLKKIINKRLTVRQLDLEIKKQKGETVDDVPLVNPKPDLEKMINNATDINKEPENKKKGPDTMEPTIPQTEEPQQTIPNKFFNFLEDEAANMNMDVSMASSQQKPATDNTIEVLDDFEDYSKEPQQEEVITPFLFDNNANTTTNNTIEEIKPQKEDNVVDPMDSVIKLDPNYNQMLEEARGIDLKTAINEIRDLVQKMEEQGFSLSLDEIDLADKYQMTINIQKSE
ncbi:TPA: ParB/RepB/Spo0J family partition protein [Candidatus Ventrenecus stercoripullorum]|nr:ParB/RepB/Spo0J family partition protein [Candidatus Ventrenecus stercoripullorum]